MSATDAPALALSFDDGPGPSTSALLDVLARHGARATFFIVGKNLRGAALEGDAGAARALALRALREGHLLGNHSDTHARDPLPRGALAAEIRAVDAALAELYTAAGRDVPAPLPLRLPYGPLVRDGAVLDERLEAIAAVGRWHVHWTGIFGDWEPATDPAELTARLESHVRAQWELGVLPLLALHDAGTRRRSNGFDRGATVTAVDALCRALAPARPRYATVDELATLAAPRI